jgi:hypothetical protein
MVVEGKDNANSSWKQSSSEYPPNCFKIVFAWLAHPTKSSRVASIVLACNENVEGSFVAKIPVLSFSRTSPRFLNTFG